ncbi:MAG: family 1 glycosylhydrolase [Microcella sp.]|uniref:family 1 glycosylhydrolase n=1 Tax=Microcella sp. TaxID=1913979 RepID=UPI003315B93A
MKLFLDLDFSHFGRDRFFFGVANAPYLAEGGLNTPDGPKNSYGFLEQSGDFPVSGEGTRYWTDYQAHIDLAQSLGLTAFRTGIEWARVQPTRDLAAGPAPAWDEDALDRYADIILQVQRAGMEPIITLHHFTHPAWLGPIFWTDENAPDPMVEYEVSVVEKLSSRLVALGGEPIGHMITFNELNLIPLLYFGAHVPVKDREESFKNYPIVYDNILSAHMRVYDGIKDLYEDRGWANPLVGFGTATQSPYEFDRLMLDIARLRSWSVKREDAESFLAQKKRDWDTQLGGLARRQLTDEQLDYREGFLSWASASVQPMAFTKTLDAIYGSSRAEKIDYISANVYEPFGVERSRGDSDRSPKWWEFAVDGDIYRTMIHAYNDGNTDLPIFMGENSIAYKQVPGEAAEPRPDGWSRERYLKTYFMEMIRCIAEGVPIKGYLYWSLVDDFEWNAGFPPRLGLYNYDYETHAIGSTDGLGEPAGDIYAWLIDALRSGDKARVREAFVNSYAYAQRTGRV